MTERTAVEALAEALFRSHQADFVSSAQRHVDDLAARGYRLVPEVPTAEMIEAGEENIVETYGTDLAYVYRAMLDAEPGAPKKEEGA